MGSQTTPISYSVSVSFERTGHRTTRAHRMNWQSHLATGTEITSLTRHDLARAAIEVLGARHKAEPRQERSWPAQCSPVATVGVPAA